MTTKFMTEENPTPQETKLSAPEKDEWSWGEFLRFAIIAALIVLPIRFFVAEPFIVRQTSMKPTFIQNDYLIVEKISSEAKNPSRGDVIIFRSPVEQGRSLIKRVIGLPGETVSIDKETVKISKKTNNATSSEPVILKEPYVVFNAPSIVNGSWALGADEYFVMGDNRPESYDSRMFGPIKKNNIIGEPIVRFYRFDAISWRPGFFTYGY